MLGAQERDIARHERRGSGRRGGVQLLLLSDDVRHAAAVGSALFRAAQQPVVDEKPKRLTPTAARESGHGQRGFPPESLILLTRRRSTVFSFPAQQSDISTAPRVLRGPVRRKSSFFISIEASQRKSYVHMCIVRMLFTYTLTRSTFSTYYYYRQRIENIFRGHRIIIILIALLLL